MQTLGWWAIGSRGRALNEDVHDEIANQGEGGSGDWQRDAGYIDGGETVASQLSRAWERRGILVLLMRRFSLISVMVARLHSGV